MTLDPELVTRLDRVEKKIDRAVQSLTALQQLVLTLQIGADVMAGELDRLETQVRENTTVDQSAVTLLTQLSDLIRSNAADPARLTAIADNLKNNAAALARAIQENTPTPPAPTPPAPPAP